MRRRIRVMFLTFLVCLSVRQTAWATESATLTFSDAGITATGGQDGYSIDGTTLTITDAGVYRLTGSCGEGSVVVKGSVDGAVLIFDNLTLSSAFTAPVVVKKSSDVTIHLEGTSTLTDAEDASTEETNSDFEGAAIKVKSGSAVTFCGDGTLTINGNAKNGIKGASEASLTFVSGTYKVTAQNNGIASDGSLLFESGSYVVDSENDGIKAVPEADDTASAGTITINGGSYVITADGDGIQADAKLAISNGSFDITTFGGYNASGFDKDTMSCKGLKASGDRELESLLVVSGGSFKLNTADDAVHSDANVEVTGGTFTISTGDDGMHGDTSLVLGTEGGHERDPQVTIEASYEGLEAGTVYVYSGKYWIVASDDGINAADGSGNGTDPGQGGGDSFRPGGRPGMGGFGLEAASFGGSYDYNLYVYGGDIYVNCTGDGLDSNGGLYLYGGNQTVLSQGVGGDNSPLDCDGAMVVKGATVFAAGTNPMNENPDSGSQANYRWAERYDAGTTVTIKSGTETLYSEQLLRSVNYVLFSSPSVSSQPSLVTNESLDACKSNAWQHSYGSAEVVSAATATSSGLVRFTCQSCGKTEYQTVPAEHTASCNGHQTGSQSDTADNQETTQSMYRLYNPNSGEHFYTADANEKNEIVAAGWKYEGIGWTAPVKSNTPVYRLYNANGGEHHYTTSQAERDALVAAGWKDEGIGWYSDDSQGVALLREYNPNQLSCNHNYTTSQTEHDELVALGWKDEGIAWYGVAG